MKISLLLGGCLLVLFIVDRHYEHPDYDSVLEPRRIISFADGGQQLIQTQYPHDSNVDSLLKMSLDEVSTENPLTKWSDDATVTQGTYVQKDNSAKLIYPWAYDSDVFDLRRDRPFDWFDDDDPREAISIRQRMLSSKFLKN